MSNPTLERVRAHSTETRVAAARREGRTCPHCPPRLARVCLHAGHRTGDTLERFAALCDEIASNGPAAAAAPAPIPAPIPAPDASDAMATLRRLLVDVDAVKAEATAAALSAVESRIAAVEAAKGSPSFHVKVNDAPAVEIQGVAHEAFRTIHRNVAAGVHTAMIGPAGCGKTFLARQVASAMGLPFRLVSLSGGATEATLLGYQILAKDGGVDYVGTAFTDAYENGGLVLLDEMDATDANVLLCLNAALEGDEVPLPRRHGAQVARRHKDFRVLAALNTYGHGADRRYVGRNTLDGASLSRFRAGQVPMDYDPAMEARMAIDSAIHAWALKVRAAIREHAVQDNLDTRYLLNATKLKGAGAPDRGPDSWRAGFFAGMKPDTLQRFPEALRS